MIIFLPRKQDRRLPTMVRLRSACAAPAVCVLILQIASCSPGGRTDDSAQAEKTDAAVVTSLDTAGDSASAPGSSDGCPKFGLWRICSVEDRLTRAGLVFTRAEEPIRHDFMHVPGVAYEVSRATLQLFLYPSAAERARDTDGLDSNTVSPRGSRIIWPRTATLVTSNNLAAIILSFNERQTERLALALGAGLPVR
jgi:hypothetical protein